MLPGVQVPKVSRCPQYHNAPECVAAASLPDLCPGPERGLPRLRPLRPAPGKLSLSCHTSCHSCHVQFPPGSGRALYLPHCVGGVTHNYCDAVCTGEQVSDHDVTENDDDDDDRWEL